MDTFRHRRLLSAAAFLAVMLFAGAVFAQVLPVPPSVPSEPPSLNPTPTPSMKFQLNDRVETTDVLNVRATPTTSGTLLGTQPLGSAGTVIGGPTFADSYWWWSIDYDNAPDGWSVEDFLTIVSGPYLPIPPVVPVPPPNFDTTPPVIVTAPAATGITDTAAMVTWTTDEPSTSQVEYGASIAYGSQTTLDAMMLVTSHSVSLSGLTASTLYHYRVRSKDADNNEVVSSDNTFTTLPPPDGTPPVRSNGSPSGVLAVNTTQVTLSLNTNEDATCKYGIASASFDALPNIFSTTGAMAHTQSISGLTNGTSYTYYVRCMDAMGNKNSDDYLISFSVASESPDVTAPIVPQSPAASSVSQMQINVVWNASMDPVIGGQVTSGLAGYRIYRCQSAGCVPGGASIGSTASLSFSSTGLTANTTYGYAVTAFDNAGNESAMSTTAYATTQGDITPPTIANVVESFGSTSGTITWTTDEPADGRIDYGTSPSTMTLSKTQTGLSTTHSISFTGLSKKTIYYYRIISKDASLNIGYYPSSTGNDWFATAGAKTANLQASPGSIRLFWDRVTDSDVKNILIFRSMTDYPDTTGTPYATIGGLETSYRDSIVTPGITYYYTVIPRYADGTLGDPAYLSYVARAPSVDTSVAKPGYKYTRVLGSSMRGDDVKALQQFLMSQQLLGIADSTGYFGLKTIQAVKQFQCTQQIVCTGTARTTGWGMVGPQTSQRINEMTGITQTPEEQASIEDLQARITALQQMVKNLLNK